MARPDKFTPEHRWKSVIFYLRSRIDPAPGCYAIYIADELVYVGQSVNLRLRFRRYGFRRHHDLTFTTPWGEFRNVRVKVCYSRRYGDWAMRELRLIRRLSPRFNTIKYVGIDKKAGFAERRLVAFLRGGGLN